MNKYERMDLIRARIVALPGKTLRRWQDGDERCHCTHCYLCGELYRTADIDTHERECQEALLKVLEPAAPARPEPRPNPVDELTRVTEEIGGYEWQCQACKGTGKAPARPEAMTEDRPADLYEAHINTHVFKAPTYEGVQFTNCDRCGEQYGARYTRLCPVVVSEPAGPPSDTVPGDIRCRVTGKPRCQCVGCWPNWPNPH